jgi:tetratricopeptide (TPR) repeat protein
MSQELKNANDLILKGIDQLNRAYDEWDKEAFIEALETFQNSSKIAPDDHMAFYWKGVALFYLSIYHLFGRDQNRNQKQGEVWVDAGIKTLKRALILNDTYSESYALLGVLQGMKIKMHILSALSLGPQVKSNRKRALELNPENPRVHYLTGVSLWFSPEIFGGDNKLALQHFKKAEAFFEQEAQNKRDPLQPLWGRSTCLAFMGDFYSKQKNYQKAKDYYLKALQVNSKDSLAKTGLEKIKAFLEKKD